MKSKTKKLFDDSSDEGKKAVTKPKVEEKKTDSPVKRIAVSEQGKKITAVKKKALFDDSD